MGPASKSCVQLSSWRLAIDRWSARVLSVACVVIGFDIRFWRF